MGLPCRTALHTTGKIHYTLNIAEGLRELLRPSQSPKQCDRTFDHERLPSYFLTVRVRLPTLPTCIPKLCCLPDIQLQSPSLPGMPLKVANINKELHAQHHALYIHVLFTNVTWLLQSQARWRIPPLQKPGLHNVVRSKCAEPSRNQHQGPG